MLKFLLLSSLFALICCINLVFENVSDSLNPSRPFFPQSMVMQTHVQISLAVTLFTLCFVILLHEDTTRRDHNRVEQFAVKEVFMNEKRQYEQKNVC